IEQLKIALEIHYVGLFGRKWTRRAAKTRKGYWLVSSVALVTANVTSAKARQECAAINTVCLSDGVRLKLQWGGS
ncbi:MAG: hypothetical protein AB2746_05275, partial [Candidatus Thiodiazotropha taylori]